MDTSQDTALALLFKSVQILNLLDWSVPTIYPPPPKQTKKDTEEEEVDIATCSRGQYFGELALVTNKPRAASAYAMENVKCLGTVHVTFFCFHPLS